jgi:CheY-like chemotaxis protein
MLVDDNEHDNFFHERTIKKVDASIVVIKMKSGDEALDYLKQTIENTHPDLILLDINMPGMNGWEFLEQYNLLTQKMQSHALIVMLTTSSSPVELRRALSHKLINDYIIKPLTEESLKDIRARHFK